MKYQTNYDEAIKKAKKEKKPVMLVLSSSTCPWCRKMENQTLKNETINKQVQENFIPLALDKDTDSYPKEFTPQYIPTVLFINPNTGDYFDQSIGFKPVAKFQESLEEAIEDSKRFK
jgi:thiol:disulfide interchange protein